MHIGVEPTTDKFTLVRYGNEKQITPGTILANDIDDMFVPLQDFGHSFLSGFNGATVKSDVLRQITLLDTPGVLSGHKQTERAYNFSKAARWFADRSDLILLCFDVRKADIADELAEVIRNLGENLPKVRILLNKADMVPQTDLMKSYGALMWGLSKVFKTPEVRRVYMGSWKDEPYNNVSKGFHFLFDKSRQLLQEDIEALHEEVALRKLERFIRRAKLAKLHAFVFDHLRKEMPTFWGKKKKKEELIAKFEQEYRKVAKAHDIVIGELPDQLNINDLKERLKDVDFKGISKLKPKYVEAVDQLMYTRIPEIIRVVKSGFTKEALVGAPRIGKSGDATLLEKRDCVGHDVFLSPSHTFALEGMTCNATGAEGRFCLSAALYEKELDGLVERPECCGGYAQVVVGSQGANMGKLILREGDVAADVVYFKCQGIRSSGACVETHKVHNGFFRPLPLGESCATGKCKGGACP